MALGRRSPRLPRLAFLAVSPFLAALVLARPVARWQYLLGRLGASVGLVIALCLLMGVETQAIRVANGQPMSAALWGYWGIQVYNLTIICALTTLISVFAANAAIAAVLAFVIDRFASVVEALFRMSERGGVEGGLASALRVAWFLTPKTLSSPLGTNNGLGGAAFNSGRSVLSRGNFPGLVAWSLTYLLLMIGSTIIAVRCKEVRG